MYTKYLDFLSIDYLQMFSKVKPFSPKKVNGRKEAYVWPRF